MSSLHERRHQPVYSSKEQPPPPQQLQARQRQEEHVWMAQQQQYRMKRPRSFGDSSHDHHRLQQQQPSSSSFSSSRGPQQLQQLQSTERRIHPQRLQQLQQQQRYHHHEGSDYDTSPGGFRGDRKRPRSSLSLERCQPPSLSPPPPTPVPQQHQKQQQQPPRRSRWGPPPPGRKRLTDDVAPYQRPISADAPIPARSRQGEDKGTVSSEYTRAGGREEGLGSRWEMPRPVTSQGVAVTDTRPGTEGRFSPGQPRSLARHTSSLSLSSSSSHSNHNHNNSNLDELGRSSFHSHDSARASSLRERRSSFEGGRAFESRDGTYTRRWSSTSSSSVASSSRFSTSHSASREPSVPRHGSQLPPPSSSPVHRRPPPPPSSSPSHRRPSLTQPNPVASFTTATTKTNHQQDQHKRDSESTAAGAAPYIHPKLKGRFVPRAEQIKTKHVEPSNHPHDSSSSPSHLPQGTTTTSVATTDSAEKTVLHEHQPQKTKDARENLATRQTISRPEQKEPRICAAEDKTSCASKQGMEDVGVSTGLAVGPPLSQRGEELAAAKGIKPVLNGEQHGESRMIPTKASAQSNGSRIITSEPGETGKGEGPIMPVGNEQVRGEASEWAAQVIKPVSNEEQHGESRRISTKAIAPSNNSTSEPGGTGKEDSSLQTSIQCHPSGKGENHVNNKEVGDCQPQRGSAPSTSKSHHSGDGVQRTDKRAAMATEPNAEEVKQSDAFQQQVRSSQALGQKERPNGNEQGRCDASDLSTKKKNIVLKWCSKPQPRPRKETKLMGRGEKTNDCSTVTKKPATGEVDALTSTTGSTTSMTTLSMTLQEPDTHDAPFLLTDTPSTVSELTPVHATVSIVAPLLTGTTSGEENGKAKELDQAVTSSRAIENNNPIKKCKKQSVAQSKDAVGSKNPQQHASEKSSPRRKEKDGKGDRGIPKSIEVSSPGEERGHTKDKSPPRIKQPKNRPEKQTKTTEVVESSGVSEKQHDSDTKSDPKKTKKRPGSRAPMLREESDSDAEKGAASVVPTLHEQPGVECEEDKTTSALPSDGVRPKQKKKKIPKEDCKDVSLVGINARVAVFWEGDEQYYKGCVTKEKVTKKGRKKFFIEYDDGDEEWIILAKHRFRLIRSGQKNIQRSGQLKTTEAQPKEPQDSVIAAEQTNEPVGRSKTLKPSTSHSSTTLEAESQAEHKSCRKEKLVTEGNDCVKCDTGGIECAASTASADVSKSLTTVKRKRIPSSTPPRLGSGTGTDRQEPLAEKANTKRVSSLSEAGGDTDHARKKLKKKKRKTSLSSSNSDLVDSEMKMIETVKPSRRESEFVQQQVEDKSNVTESDTACSHVDLFRGEGSIDEGKSKVVYEKASVTTGKELGRTGVAFNPMLDKTTTEGQAKRVKERKLVDENSSSERLSVFVASHEGRQKKKTKKKRRESVGSLANEVLVEKARVQESVDCSGRPMPAKMGTKSSKHVAGKSKIETSRSNHPLWEEKGRSNDTKVLSQRGAGAGQRLVPPDNAMLNGCNPLNSSRLDHDVAGKTCIEPTEKEASVREGSTTFDASSLESKREEESTKPKKKRGVTLRLGSPDGRINGGIPHAPGSAELGRKLQTNLSSSPSSKIRREEIERDELVTENIHDEDWVRAGMIRRSKNESSDSETDEEEVMDWACQMFGISRPPQGDKKDPDEQIVTNKDCSPETIRLPKETVDEPRRGKLEFPMVQVPISEAVKVDRRRIPGKVESNSHEGNGTKKHNGSLPKKKRRHDIAASGMDARRPMILDNGKAKRQEESCSGKNQIKKFEPPKRPRCDMVVADTAAEREAKRRKEEGKTLTQAEINAILGEDDSMEASSNWVRRSVRQPCQSFLNAPLVKSLMEKLRSNDSDMVVLKMKKYLSDPATPELVMDAALDALEENSNCEALFIQNFNVGMRDKQMMRLLAVLQRPSCKIWCLNIGETYNVKRKTWKRFAEGLRHTKVTHMYASEHTISAELKEKFRSIIRDNRSKHSMHIDPSNLDTIVRCTHCWWNPINAKALRPFIRKRGLEHILNNPEVQGLRGYTNGATLSS